MTAISN